MIIIKVEFSVKCMGVTVGGYGSAFEVEMEDVDFKSDKERDDYISRAIYNYIIKNIDYKYSLKEITQTN